MNEAKLIFNKFLNGNMKNNTFKSNAEFTNSWNNSISMLERLGYSQLSYIDIINYIDNSDYVYYFNLFLNNINYSIILDSDVHGLSHIIRTSIYLLIISVLQNIPLDEFKLALECIFYHDIGRVNDIDDDLHGYNATKKIDFLNQKYNLEEINLIKFVITCHCLEEDSYANVLKYYNINNEKAALMILNIVKDADALDRVREYPYLDIKFLRTDASKKIVDFAYNFYNNYELNCR